LGIPLNPAVQVKAHARPPLTRRAQLNQPSESTGTPAGHRRVPKKTNPPLEGKKKWAGTAVAGWWRGSERAGPGRLVAHPGPVLALAWGPTQAPWFHIFTLLVPYSATLIFLRPCFRDNHSLRHSGVLDGLAPGRPRTSPARGSRVPGGRPLVVDAPSSESPSPVMPFSMLS